ncbi:MAG: glycosyl hydrolase [Verrucomicrobiota bacterium]
MGTNPGACGIIPSTLRDRRSPSRPVRRVLSILTLLTLVSAGHDAKWPDPTRDALPLVHWWWPAQLPTDADPGLELEGIARAGFGGVEVRTLPTADADDLLGWPGPAWVERLGAATEYGEQLGLKIDLACELPGPGMVDAFPEELREAQLTPLVETSRGGLVEMELPLGTIECLAAWPRQGPPVDLLPFIAEDEPVLRWEAPTGTWMIYGICRSPGPLPDPYSAMATRTSLEPLDVAFEFYEFGLPRAHTLRLDGAQGDWSCEVIPAFRKRRGYELREQLPALFGDGSAGTSERVLGDYRETLSDLKRASLDSWAEWVSERGSLSRVRLRGSVAHPIDLQSIADIPGFAVDGIPDERDLPVLAFAASAAHTHTKPLIAATAFHAPIDPAEVTPAAMKETVDLLWLAGANQLVLDGIIDAETAPSGLPITPLGPSSGRWRNLRAFNDYVTRCQNVLQSGAPDPDVLLYYPAHDFWTERGGIPSDPDAQAAWLRPTGFHRAATAFHDQGVVCDYLSDLALDHATVAGGRIVVGGLSYRAIILPEVRHLPEKTAVKLQALAKLGAMIGILGEWPRDVPGYPSPDIRRGTLFTAIQDIPASQVVEADDPMKLIRELKITPESMAEHGLRFVRRSHQKGRHYFIVNRSDGRVDAWVGLSRKAESAVLMDPRFLRRAGIAPTRIEDDQLQVRLVLEPGESRILRTFSSRKAEGPKWNDLEPVGSVIRIAGEWSVEFVDGGPELPAPFTTPVLGSWDTLADPRATSFSGTARFSIEVEVPHEGAWLLDLGEVAHSARLEINGNEAGRSFAPPHHIDVGRFLTAGSNRLAIEVTNLPSVALPSGLLGPVKLLPLAAE